MTQQAINYILSLFQSEDIKVRYAAMKFYGRGKINVIVRAYNPKTGEDSNYEGIVRGTVPRDVEYAINLFNNN